jgi:shikimate kinase
MGCGSLPLLKHCQNHGIPFVDLVYIEEKTNLSINAIFEQRGKSNFRRWSMKLLLNY